MWLDASAVCRVRAPAGTGFPWSVYVTIDYVQ